MSVHVLLTSTIKENQIAAVQAFISKHLPNVRGFSGCQGVDILLDEEKRTMLFDERWQSVADHQNYIQSISESGVMGQLVDYLEGAPAVSYFYPTEL